jgi:hypothetical protein
VTTFLVSGARPGTRRGLPDHGVGAGQGDGEPASDVVPAANGNITPAWVCEALYGHVKFFGQGNDRADWSLSILEEVEGSGCHWACTYPRNRRPRHVQDGDLMYLARMVEHPNDYLIYGRAPAQAYVDGRDDATPDDIALRPWKTDWPHYIRVHDAEFLAGSLSNGVRLTALMDDLGSNSFVTTQENALRGAGNINPRMSLRQQPAARLSGEGLAWMNDRFEEALQLHGRLPAEDLAGLDWPPGPVGPGRVKLMSRIREPKLGMAATVALAFAQQRCWAGSGARGSVSTLSQACPSQLFACAPRRTLALRVHGGSRCRDAKDGRPLAAGTATLPPLFCAGGSTSRRRF